MEIVSHSQLTIKQPMIMKLKDIKTATLSTLYQESGKALLSQGIGYNFSKRLENRINAINKEISKRK